MKTYNIVYSKDVNVDTLKTDLGSVGASVLKSFPALCVLTINSETEEFKTVSGVVDWEEDTHVQPVPSAWHQNRIYSISLPMVEKYYPENQGLGTTVYLIDSGIKSDHEEFQGKTIVELYSYDNSFDDETGHGTGVASLIIGKTLGVSPDVTLKSVKIQMSTEIPISDLLTAFDMVLADHQLTPVPKVVNCSWTTPKSKILDMKITELESAGLIVVAAAGNTGEAADNFSPVGLNSVLGVGASDAYDRVISWAAGASSNWGPEVDITAPGINIDVANIDGTYGKASGTSLAAGIVSAVVAQYIIEFPEMNAAQIQAKIIDRGRPDLLFRNESIYGTTPNVFIAAAGISDVFDNHQNSTIAVKRGTTTSQVLLYREDIVETINISGNIKAGLPRVNAEWMGYNAETKEIIVTPPEDLAPGIYRMYIEALNANGDRLSVATFRISVYNESPEENSAPETPEIYFRQEGDTIVISPADCHTGFCFSGANCGGIPPKGLSCDCFSNFCSTSYST